MVTLKDLTAYLRKNKGLVAPATSAESPSQHPKSPDWFARSTALLAILLTIVSLYFTNRTYSWQQKVYQESLEERILVNVWFTHNLGSTSGEVAINLANLGTHSVYVTSIQIEVPCLPETPQMLRGCDECKLAGCGVLVYDRNPTKQHQPIKPLESSGEITYTKEWNFSKYPMQNWTQENGTLSENVWVVIETTKKTSRQHPFLAVEQIIDTSKEGASANSQSK